ncbi:MAG: isocitrate/isopropylmalate family dehydrogenase, partial [Glutamicibacter sp.]
MKTYSVAVIPGDGIGPEVMGGTLDVLAAAEKKFGFALDLTTYDAGAKHYLQTGELWNPQLTRKLRGHDAILFGAMGDPAVQPGIL